MSNNAFMTMQAVTKQPRNLDLLEAGQYLVTVEDIAYETDKVDDDAERDWDDVNDVLRLFLVHADGVHHQRFYWWGYWKYNDLLKEPKFQSELKFYRKTACDKSREYAIDTRTNKRVPCEKNSKFAQDLVHEFCTAAGNGTAVPIEELKGKQLWIELVEENVFGKKRMKLLRVASESTGFKTKPRGQSGLVMPESISPVVPLF